jgi:hypothetical protein
MGKIHTHANWFIKVFGNDHPPVHVHVIHPTGKAQVFLGGEVINSGVPETVIKLAVEWVAAHHNEIRAEWERLDNPKERTLP